LLFTIGVIMSIPMETSITRASSICVITASIPLVVTGGSVKVDAIEKTTGRTIGTDVVLLGNAAIDPNVVVSIYFDALMFPLVETRQDILFKIARVSTPSLLHDVTALHFAILKN